MTKHDLKEMRNLGAELGAAKAENDRLRGLLTEVIACQSAHYGDGCGLHLSMITLAGRIKVALSQQAEPCDFGQGGISSSWRQAVIEAQAEPTDTFTAVDMATAAAQAFRDGQAATVKECWTVQPIAYAVFAANGNVACFSTQRDHPSLVAFESDGHSVVSLAPIALSAQGTGDASA